MRVAMICPIPFGADGIYGGGTRYPQELARAMNGFAECDLIVFGGEHRESVDPYGLRHIALRDRRGGTLNADAISVQVASVTAGYDVIHFHTVNKVAVAGAFLARLRGARAFLTPLGGGGRAGISRYRLFRLFDGFPVISEFSSTQYPWLRERPNRVIYGGGDASGFPSLPGASAHREARIVCVGRISAHKGIDVLIRALPSGAELVVCGQVLDAEYGAHLSRLAVGKKVEFVPAASDSVVSGLYASAAAAVLPSVFQDFRGERHHFPELLGLVLLEAMWHATPVVASRLGATPEIVADGDNGFLVEPGDHLALRRALVSLLESSSLQAEMGASGRRKVEEQFTWRRVAERTFDFYRELPSGRFRSRGCRLSGGARSTATS